MAQGREGDDVEGFVRGHFSVESDGFCANRDPLIAVRKLVAAFGFRSQIKLGAGPSFELSGDPKEISCPAFFQLELKFNDGTRLTPGDELATVDGELDFGRADMKGTRHPIYQGPEYRLEFAFQFFGREWAERRPVEVTKARRSIRYLRLPFAAREASNGR